MRQIVGMKIWPLQDAKNQLSRVVDQAVSDGAQTITRHGKPTAVVLSISDYQKLVPKNSVNELLDSVRGTNLRIPRSRGSGRKVEL
jgi:prevent-host-death family protein